MNDIRLKIKFSGTYCISCTHAIKKAISKLDGVDKIKLNFARKYYIISIDSALKKNQIIKNINKIVNKIEPGIELKIKDISNGK